MAFNCLIFIQFYSFIYTACSTIASSYTKGSVCILLSTVERKKEKKNSRESLCSLIHQQKHIIRIKTQNLVSRKTEAVFFVLVFIKSVEMSGIHK